MINTLLMSLLFSSAEPWTVVTRESGFVVEVQSVKGSAHENVRVTATSTASPDAVMTALWGKLEDRSLNPEVIRRQIFVDGEKERLYWDLVRAPPVSDRDYVMKASHERDDAGVHLHRFETVKDDRKPEQPNVVRMTVRGQCTITPAANGGSSIVYEIFTDVGGSIPAFIAKGPQRKSATQFVKEIRARAERK